MHEIMTFLQEMFLCKDNDKAKIGLTQFKTEAVIEKNKKVVTKSASEVKLSDLMRRSY